MGRFSTTLHIKNNTNREKFTKSFYKAMKKRGFLPCSEDEAAVSYFLGFGGGWVTLANVDYSDNPKKAKTDVSELSKEMKTAVFSVEVVDSDFAILNFNGDMVIVGDGSGYGFEDAPKGDRKLWEPLFEEGKTWEEFSKSVEKNEVFVEDALWEVAQVLGIEPRYICSDHRDFSEAKDNDENITAFHFKRAIPLLTLNAAFNKVFGEGLEPLGFKRLKNTKNKHPFYVRVINGEILHIITFRQISSEKIGYKSIEVLGGVATVYRKYLDFLYHTNNPMDELPDTMRQFWNYPELEVDESFMKSATTNNYVWMYGMKGLTTEQEIRENFRCSISHFLISSENNDEMLKNLDMAFNVLKNVTLKILDKTTDLESCIDYFYRHRRLYLHSFDKMIDDGWSEALLLIKAKYRVDGIAQMERDLVKYSKHYSSKQQDIDKKRIEADADRLEQIALRDKMIDDPELNKRVLEELDRRKAANIERLKEFGLEF